MENREIRFRAWNIAKKEMVYHGAFQFEQFPTTGLQPENNRQLVFPFAGIESGEMITDRPLEAWKIMQYSGLKDKNGKEIYEGDIVVVYDMEPIVVEYKNGGFGYNARFVKDDFIGICGHNYREWLLEGMKVIGNRYENPELLIQLNKAEE